MKTIQKYFLLIVAVMAVAVSCRDEDLNRTPDWNESVGAYTIVTTNPNATFYDLTKPLAGQFIEFTIDVAGYGITEVNSVDIELAFTEKDRLFDPFQQIPVDSVYDPIILETVSTFPATIQVSTEDIAAAMGMASVTDIELGDNFNLTFPIHTADGRRLTVALNSDLCNQPAQPTFGGCNFAWVATCPSNIPLGLYHAVSDATSTDGCPPTNPLVGYAYDVTLSASGAGQYEISDFFAGVYINWYGVCYGYTFETNASFTDICNGLVFNFQDAFGATVQGTGTYNPGTGVITYTWVNDFGDTGTSTLTPD